MYTPDDRDLYFTSTLIAGLMYRGAGTTQTLFSLVENVLEYLSIHLKPVELRLLKRLVLNRLRLFGFVETISNRRSSRWVVAPNRLFQHRSGQALILGSTMFGESVRDALGSDGWGSHLIYKFPVATGADLSLRVPQVSLDYKEAEFAIDQTGAELVRSPDLIQRLPAIQQAFEWCKGKHQVSSAISGSTEIQVFDYSEFQWREAEPRNIASGLYRLPHQFGGYQHLLFKRVSQNLVGFRLHEEGWVVFIGAHLLGISLNWRYAPSLQRLSIPARQISFAPVVVKKALFVRAFRWPELSSHHYHANDISPRDAARLASLFPMLGISYV